MDYINMMVGSVTIILNISIHSTPLCKEFQRDLVQIYDIAAFTLKS